MAKILSIACGGACGALLRYFSSEIVTRYFNTRWEGLPWDTVFVNIIGSFLIGLFSGLLDQKLLSEQLKPLILIGGLGAFTTFSAFSMENFILLKQNRYALALAYTVMSLILGLCAVVAGYLLSKSFIKQG